MRVWKQELYGLIKLSLQTVGQIADCGDSTVISEADFIG